MVFVAALLWESVKMKLTFPKLGLGSPLGLLKFQSSIAGVKTPHIEVFFISWESYQSVDVKNGSHGPFGHLNWQFDSRPLKIGNRPNLDVCRWNVIHRWKALKESYKFVLNLIPIGGSSKELWPRKVPGVQIETISGILLGSLGTKSHSDVGVAERHKIYYMGESGGFPWVRAVVSSCESKVARGLS
jgi:hypothetical protein